MKIIDLLDHESTSNAKFFIKKIYSMGHTNPLGNGVVFSFKRKTDNETALIKLVLRPNPNGGVTISELMVLENQIKKGFGTRVLNLITKEADKQGIVLNLFPVPLKVHGQKPISKSKLVSFYKKNGFVMTTQGDMNRQPKT